MLAENLEPRNIWRSDTQALRILPRFSFSKEKNIVGIELFSTINLLDCRFVPIEFGDKSIKHTDTFVLPRVWAQHGHL